MTKREHRVFDVIAGLVVIGALVIAAVLAFA
jgi:hypothetical protein